MPKKCDALTRFWRDLEPRVRTAARLIVVGSTVVPFDEHRDLSQATLLDLHVFVDRRRSEDPELTLELLLGEVKAWGAVCLENNFLDIVRKYRRRAPRLKTLGGNSSEVEGYVDFAHKRVATPFEREVAFDWIERTRCTSRSPKVHSILDALHKGVAEDIDLLPKDVQLIAGVNSNDMHHFRERVSFPSEKGE